VKAVVGMSAAMARTAVDGVAVGREGSCERMLRDLLDVAVSICAVIYLEMGYGNFLTSSLAQAQGFGELLLGRELVVDSRLLARKRSVDSVGRTLCEMVFLCQLVGVCSPPIDHVDGGLRTCDPKTARRNYGGLFVPKLLFSFTTPRAEQSFSQNFPSIEL
jgi:hypothetical protein